MSSMSTGASVRDPRSARFSISHRRLVRMIIALGCSSVRLVFCSIASLERVPNRFEFAEMRFQTAKPDGPQLRDSAECNPSFGVVKYGLFPVRDFSTS